jgi:hypothetical protein
VNCTVFFGTAKGTAKGAGKETAKGTTKGISAFAAGARDLGAAVGTGVASFTIAGSLNKSTELRSSYTEIGGSETAFDFQASTTWDHDTIS